MNKIDKLNRYLTGLYEKMTPASRRLYERAEKVMSGGGSHGVRLFKPYPLFIAGTKGSMVRDFDGNGIIDYWQGHYANILGHEPEALKTGPASDDEGDSCHSGFESVHQIELAEIILRSLGAEGSYKVRFTTSGTLATMYAVMVSMAYTGRDLILKIGGGWHGASPYLLKGVKFHEGRGFQEPESAGVPPSFTRKTLVTGYNDCEGLERIMKKHGDRIACLILEPFLGVAGFIPADPEFLRLARMLTARHGSLLIFDEIISGFRFCPSGVQTLYGVKPDMSAFGKIIGGGHAVSAIVGRTSIMEGCLRGANGRSKVYFQGGTFSAHPEYMKAGLRMLRYLTGNAALVYPRLAANGEKLRRGIEAAFSGQGIPVLVTGDGNKAVAGSSVFMVHFPKKDIDPVRPELLQNPEYSDTMLREEIIKLALILEGVYSVHGGGSVSFAHSDADIDKTLQAYARVAELFRKSLY